MLIKNNKTMATLIAIFLTITIAIPLVTIPIANAAPVHHKATHAYIGATPNPVGVGQETLIHLGITDELQNVAHGWEGLTVTVTKPDNTTETLGPFKTDSTGGTGTVLVPTMIGTYYLQTHFPAQWYNWTLYGGAAIYYEASSSSKLALVVTEEPRKYYPGSPLPSEYWSRPIDSQHYEWSVISGDWVQPVRNVGPYIPNNQDAPESAHILWAKPLTLGGLAGGELGNQGYEDGDAYEGLWGYGSPVIISGIMFYNKYKDVGTTALEREVVAVNLKTGEELWSRALKGPDNVSRPLQFGQVFYWDSYNYHGVFSYLWTTSTTSGVNTWNAFDPFSGRWVYSMTNVPSGTMVRGAKGEIYIYTFNLANGWMTLWNSSRVVSNEGSWIRNSMGTTYNIAWTAARQGGYEWNKTIPKGLPGNVNAVFLEDRLIGSRTYDRTAQMNVEGKSADPLPIWGVSLKPGQEGTLLFNKTWQPPTGNLSLTFEEASVEAGIFTVWSKELRARTAFDINTGERRWGPTEPEHYLQVFGRQSSIAYGKLYSTGFGGYVYAYDVKTGERLWTYTVDDPLTEILWSDNWPMGILFVTDGKIYLGHSEHSPVDPKPRGGPFLALDAETGEVVWRIDGAFRTARWAGQAGIADSVIGMYNTYDNQVYAIGKGPSATTVVASPKTSVLGSSVLIEGTVTDISPGTKDPRLTARFPNGVPAVSDASMSEWMKYVYMQFERPMDATGVEVILSVIDSNGNFYEIGKTTSDASGTYSYQWNPEITGKYTIIASFAGSKSYWGSYSQTAVGVDEAPQTTPAPTPISSMADQYFVPAVAGIIAAIAIVGALIMLMLRKRP